MPSIYQTINQRAEAIKADRWRHYIPLSRFQLTDYDAAADDETEDVSVTIIALTADPQPNPRSTHRSAVRYKQFKIIKRPTEVLAVRYLNCPADEAPVTRIEPIATRWCIICKDRHPIDAFMAFPEPNRKRQSATEYNRNKRYVHGLSYACRNKLLIGYNGRRWRISA